MLTIVAPGLCARSPAALAAAPALRAFSRVARTPAQSGDGLHAAMFAALGAAGRVPSAPLAAAGAGVDVGDDYVLAATPVTLVAGRDDVIVAARVSDLDAGDAPALLEALNRHFAADGLAFFAPDATRWYARTAIAPDLATTPLDVALARPMFPHLPRGGDSGRWQRWGSEIQMLLHGHPVNAAREARGAAPINAIWFWGGGRLADVDPVDGLAVAACPGEVGDALRGLAIRSSGAAGALPQDLAALPARVAGARIAAIALQGIETDEALAAFGAAWLAPALEALERGRIGLLQLVSDGHGAAVTWRAPRPGALARLAARFSGRTFEVPAPPEA